MSIGSKRRVGSADTVAAAKAGLLRIGDLGISFPTHGHRRRLRTILLICVVSFGVCFVLGMALSVILAGELQFWHVWGWFGYGAGCNAGNMLGLNAIFLVSIGGINVPALPCAGATGAVSGLVLRKVNAYRIPVYPETHRKRNTSVSASGRRRLDRFGSDEPQYAMLSERPGVGPGCLTKNIEYRKSLCGQLSGKVV